MLIKTFYKDVEYKNIFPIVSAMTNPDGLKKIVRDMNDILYPHKSRDMGKFADKAKKVMDSLRGKTIKVRSK